MERMMAYLLAEGILLRPRDCVVVVEGLLEGLGGDAHLLRECLAALEALHESTADVVLAVPLDLLRRVAVEHKTDGELRNIDQCVFTRRTALIRTLPFSHILPVTKSRC